MPVIQPYPAIIPPVWKEHPGVDALKILLTNDDGIHAPGLWAAAQALSRVGEVFVSAPDREQSGTGASLTLHRPVKARQVLVAAYCPELAAEGGSGLRQPVTAYAVEGTPATVASLPWSSLRARWTSSFPASTPAPTSAGT